MLSFEEYNIVLESAEAGLSAKAEKSGVSIGTLRKVYKRGVAAWNSGHRPGTTPQQWGMARVNSYITKGKGTYHGADKDLREEEIQENNLPEVPKHKESGLPKKYVAGLSDATAKARAAHFDKADKLSDKDPEAYKPAPGDANAKTKESEHTKKYRAMFGEDMDEELYEACWDTHKQVGMKKKGDKMVPDCVPKNEEVDLEEGTPYYNKPSFLKKMSRVAKQEQQAREKKEAEAKKPVKEELSADEQFDVIEEMVMAMAEEYNIDPETVWEKFEAVDDVALYEAAVDAKGHKSSTGGLTQKGRDAYNAKGANLQAPVTTPPSELKAGSKAANRRKSFCARMGGMEGPMKKPNGEPTRKALALRKWNC
jgi:hypothetical protein